MKPNQLFRKSILIMKNLRRPLFAASMVAVAALLATAAPATATTHGVALDELSDTTVYATSYVSAGATATIEGDVLAGLYLTTGAGSTINGDAAAVGATTLGAAASAVDICSEGATTLGATATVTGTVHSGGAFTAGALADIDEDDVNVGSICVPPPAASAAAFKGDLVTARTAVAGLAPTIPPATNPGPLPGSIASDVTYTPGVYDVSGLLTIAAGVTITLDTEGASDAEFIFNISSYLAVGAGVNVEVLGADADTSVVWNVGSGYVTVGAGANIVGTVMAGSYVSLGAESSITGPGCYAGGAAYSLNGYVSLGAAATVGGVNSSCES
ncbi:MAG: hypothetical protein ACI9C1_000793 [Candidatus Aldehydirespiratoraceae bacterium]|jgi:hypothetical protein